MKRFRVVVASLTMLGLSLSAGADSVGYYFNLSNELIDLTYPGDTFYGEVYLNLPMDNNLDITVNPYSAPGELNSLGDFVNSPLVASTNFGVQQFAFDSELIITEEDFTTFLSLYDVVIPDQWDVQFNGQVSEFGKFEFVYSGTGSTRQDPLIINISPKEGADLTGYWFNTVFTFVEPNASGSLFAAHIAGFTTDPDYWEEGAGNPESAYFGVAQNTRIPEPTTLILAAMGILAWGVRRMRKR